MQTNGEEETGIAEGEAGARQEAEAAATAAATEAAATEAAAAAEGTETGESQTGPPEGTSLAETLKSLPPEERDAVLTSYLADEEYATASPVVGEMRRRAEQRGRTTASEDKDHMGKLRQVQMAVAQRGGQAQDALATAFQRMRGAGQDAMLSEMGSLDDLETHIHTWSAGQVAAASVLASQGIAGFISENAELVDDLTPQEDEAFAAAVREEVREPGLMRPHISILRVMFDRAKGVGAQREQEIRQNEREKVIRDMQKGGKLEKSLATAAQQTAPLLGAGAGVTATTREQLLKGYGDGTLTPAQEKEAEKILHP